MCLSRVNRDQMDYQSKYCSVVEYFDAVKIALTATPALQTTEIFGQPVFKYTYREAIIEGYLVDHDAPHRLSAKLSAEGIHYRKGDTVVRYDPVTGEVTNSELLEDELDFDVESFNRQVITEPFNRTVLAEIARDIDPESPDVQGKTLIFAVNDDHADLIVKILKEIYTEMGMDNDAIMKITGSVGGGNKKKVKDTIKRFKNERFPEIHRTHFEIYDPVGVYDSLEAVNTMKPVVANPGATFEQLLDGLEVLEDERQVKNQIDQIIAKLQRKKRHMDAETMEHFVNMTGGQDPTQFIADIQLLVPRVEQSEVNRRLQCPLMTLTVLSNRAAVPRW